MNPCIMTMCRRRVFKDGEIFRYQNGGVICPTCWEKMEGDE
jgi:hypothetical protein